MDIAQKQTFRDPVCGMLVDERTAAGHVSFEGTDYHFCCPRCQKQFEENPAKYLNREAPVPSKPQIVQIAPAPSVLHHDPVCGMNIKQQNATGTVEHNGTLYYFCSNSCVEKFKANPQQYLEPKKAPSPTPQAQQVEYTCTMDPEVR
ncbi:MAG: YHS domain-containing protein, partial [Acidobacteriota bacterium]|nr:YHS domain-containing protein [Acidobacteriota bacterium]